MARTVTTMKITAMIKAIRATVAIGTPGSHKGRRLLIRPASDHEGAADREERQAEGLEDHQQGEEADAR